MMMGGGVAGNERGITPPSKTRAPKQKNLSQKASRGHKKLRSPEKKKKKKRQQGEKRKKACRPGRKRRKKKATHVRKVWSGAGKVGVSIGVQAGSERGVER